MATTFVKFWLRNSEEDSINHKNEKTMRRRNNDFFNLEDIERKLLAPTPKELENLTLLKAVDGIVSRSSDSGLTDEFMNMVEPFSAYLGERLKITKTQAVLFSLFIEQSGWSAVTLENLCSHLQCHRTSLLMHLDEIEDLVSKRLLKRNSGIDSSGYNVPMGVLKCLAANKPFIAPEYSKMTEEELFDTIMDLYERNSRNDLDDESLFLEINSVLKANQELPFVKALSGYTKNQDLKTVLVYLCALYVSECKDKFDQSDIRDALQSPKSFRAMLRSLERGENQLITDGLLVFDSAESFFDRGSYRFTKKGLKKFLPEHKMKSRNETNEINNSLISHKKVTEKKLFFNADVNAQVERLANLLQPQHFRNITANLEKHGMRKGFACLFYGSPGTGKTETVYQLARATGRDIFPVNVEQIKSMWVGQSEKNIKAAFAAYKEMCSKKKIQPIMLFNEADAIFGIRREGAESAVDKMENAIQNIILQEMESMEGILIATTNLTDNIDKAFERRFLYKIDFKRPETAVRAKIWESLIPGLSDDVATRLASEFDFSGGQIENISRMKAVDAVLTGNESLDYNVLSEYCRTETLQRAGSIKKIGF